jgi:porin
MTASAARRSARLVLLAAAVFGSSWAAAAESVHEPDDAPAAESPGSSESLWNRESLTGDWGGLRHRLAERGVTLEFVHTADVIGVVSGGLDHGANHLSNFDLMLSAETEPLFGWRGGKLFVYGLGLSNSGSPSAKAGDIQALDNIDAPEEWKLYELWFQQEMFGGRLSLLTGLYDVNGEFDVIETATLFLNSSFGIGKDISQTGENGPSIFPSTSFGVRLDSQPVARTYARFAVLDGVPGDPQGEHAGSGYFALNRDDGVFCIGEAGYLAGAEERSAGPYTKIGLGGWLHSADVDRIGGGRRDGHFGMYLLGERAVHREPQDPGRGLAAFARVGFADSEVNAVGFYAGGGLAYTGLFRRRREDRLGLGVAAAVAGDEFEEASEAEGTPLSGAEVAIELTYRMQLTPWLAVQPDIQYIVDPGFDEDVGNALALGTRVEVAF